jgi:hypothetical protein
MSSEQVGGHGDRAWVKRNWERLERLEGRVVSPRFHSHSDRLSLEPGACWGPSSLSAAISLTVLGLLLGSL